MMAFTGFIADVIEPKHTVETWAYVRWQFQCVKCDDDSSGSIVVDCQRLVAASQLKKKKFTTAVYITREYIRLSEAYLFRIAHKANLVGSDSQSIMYHIEKAQFSPPVTWCSLRGRGSTQSVIAGSSPRSAMAC